MTRWQWFAVVAVAVIVVMTLLVHDALADAQERPAVQREHARSVLAEYATVLAAYRAANAGAWPADHNAIRAFSASDETLPKITRGSVLVRGAGRYRYQPPTETTPGDHLVMASAMANIGVAAGEPWGAKGEVTEVAIPPVQIALTVDLVVVELSEAEQAARAPWLTEEQAP